jgi:hypothetical protein
VYNPLRHAEGGLNNNKWIWILCRSIFHEKAKTIEEIKNEILS